MATPLTADPHPPRETHSEKNILKSKPSNHSEADSPGKPDNPRSIDGKPHPDDARLLLQKKGSRLTPDGPASNLRSIIADHDADYKESKPFHKKYGTNLPKASHKAALQSEEKEKEQAKPEGKNKTRESFNKKLNSNIIKDEEQPSPLSKQSFRIKKVERGEKGEARSPKKLRDDLIALNDDEMKLQREILETHKQYKAQLERVQQEYGLAANKLEKHFPEESHAQHEGELEKLLGRVEERLKQKRKELAKLQLKIEHNTYQQYLASPPPDIEEIHSSEEEDIVEELPDHPPRPANQGSYSQAMPSLKHKNHSLNLRRTYEVFRQDKAQPAPE